MFWNKKKDVEILQINEKTIIHEDNIYIRHDEHAERELLKIISTETGIIEMLLKDEHKKRPRLSATYIFNGFKIHSNFMATIQISDSQNSVTGQLVPLSADSTPQPISSVQAGSETYTSTDTSIASASADGGVEGQFKVTRVSNDGGTITVNYSALNANGDTITGSDDFVFAAVVQTPVLATSLSATFQDPT